MLRNLFIAASCMALTAVASDPARMPVLVELFTSEGCSSCPPADLHLARLDSQVIVLSEHVDYWDSLGWKDKFSSPSFTERQQVYAKQFGLDSPYTPQMVVDGVAQFTGGDARRAMAEIDKAASHPKTDIFLARSGGGIEVEIQGSAREAGIWLALADNSALTKVAAGENKGRTLTHVAVVRSLRKIGYVKRGGKFSRRMDLPSGAAGQRVVVFLQEDGQARVLGVAMLPAPEI